MLTNEKVRQFGFDDSVLYYSCLQESVGETNFRTILNKYGPFEVGIEIGTYNGLSSIVIRDYCNELHCMDILDNDMRQKLWAAFDLSAVTFRKINNEHEKASYVNTIKGNTDIDFAFVDGDHTYSGALADIELCADIPYVLVDNIEMHDVMQAVEDSGRKYDAHHTFAMLTERK